MSSKGKKSNKRSVLISETNIQLLQYRISQEDRSNRYYLAMSLYLNNNGYLNAAKLWRLYADEELTHVDWAREYLLSLGIQPETPALEQQPFEFNGLGDVIEKSCEFMIEITNQLKELGTSALSDNDHMLYGLAQKYLTDQIEGLNKFQNWADQLKTFGSDRIALRLLDTAMGKAIEEYTDSDSDDE